MHRILAIVGGLILVAVIVYGFRQGQKVTPDDRPDHGPSVGGGPDHYG